MSGADPPTLLYNLCLDAEALAALMDEIHASGYIDEINSGEGPREACPLYNEIKPATSLAADADTSDEALLRHAGHAQGCIVVVDQKPAKSVRIVLAGGADVGTKRDEIHVAPRDAIEVCVNLRMANMDIAEFKSLASKSGGIYDSGQ